MPVLKIAINGLGRIGCLLFKELIGHSRVQIVALNDLKSGAQLAYLLNHATDNYSKHHPKFTFANGFLHYGSYAVLVTHHAYPQQCPWQQLKVDLVFEATGQFRKITQLQQHLTAGARQVLLTTNFQDVSPNYKTLIYNFNHQTYRSTDQIIALGSCTTNCLVLSLAALRQVVQFDQVWVQTIHAITNEQSLLDRLHEQPHLRRSVLNNIIPTPTKANAGIRLFFPDLEVIVSAVRVPVNVGSLLNISLVVKQPLDASSLHKRLQSCVNASFNITDRHFVSSNIIGNPVMAVLSTQLTQVANQLLKIGVWYDNEFGYVGQLVRFLNYLLKQQ